MKTKLREMIIKMSKNVNAIRGAYAIAICLIMIDVICGIVSVPGTVLQILSIAIILVILMVYVMDSIYKTPNYILKKKKLENIIMGDPHVWYFMFSSVAIMIVAATNAVNGIGSAFVVGLFIGCIVVVITDPIAKRFKEKIKK